MRLLVHWEKETFGHFAEADGAVLGHHGWDDARLRDHVLERPDWQLFDYFNVWQMPLPAWLDGSNPWFEYLRTIPPYRDAAGQIVRERFRGRAIIGWANANVAEAANVMIAAKETRNPRGRGGVFLDHWWPALAQWMSDQIADLPLEILAAHRAALLELRDRLDLRAMPVLTNGDRELRNLMIWPGYLEDVGGRIPWAEALPLWGGAVVLSVNADNPAEVSRALLEWNRIAGRWLAFTDGGTGTAATAYRRALEWRKAQ